MSFEPKYIVSQPSELFEVMNPFDLLPTEDLLEVCHNLDDVDLLRFMRSSKRFSQVCSLEISKRRNEFVREILHEVPIYIKVEVGSNDRWKTVKVYRYQIYVGDGFHELINGETYPGAVTLKNKIKEYELAVYSTNSNYKLAKLMYESAKSNIPITIGINLEKWGRRVNLTIVDVRFMDKDIAVNEKLPITFDISVPVIIAAYRTNDPETGITIYKQIP